MQIVILHYSVETALNIVDRSAKSFQDLKKKTVHGILVNRSDCPSKMLVTTVNYRN